MAVVVGALDDSAAVVSLLSLVELGSVCKLVAFDDKLEVTIALCEDVSAVSARSVESVFDVELV